MSEGQLLYLVFVLIYLSDCFVWTAQNSVIFVGGFLNGFSPRFASSFWGLGFNGLVPLNFLPLPGEVFSCHLTPVSISPSLIVSYNPHTINTASAIKPNIQQYAIEQITEVTNESQDVLINGKIFCKCGSLSLAENIVKLIKGLKPLSIDKRDTLIKEWWQEQYESKKAKLILSQVKDKKREISILGSLLFCFIFLITPFLAYLIGLNRTILLAGALIFILAISIAIIFFRFHRDLYPGLKYDRIINIIKMIICPPVAIRSADQISIDALAGFNPLVAAHLLLTPKKFKIFAGEFYRCLKYPLLDKEFQKPLLDTFDCQKKELLAVTERFLRSINYDVKEFTLPDRMDKKSVSYCPRCLNESCEALEECIDCIGVKMMPLGRF